MTCRILIYIVTLDSCDIALVTNRLFKLFLVSSPTVFVKLWLNGPQYRISVFMYVCSQSFFMCTIQSKLRACLRGGAGPQVGEVTRLSIWSLILIWSRLHERWGDPPHVTSPIWGPPPPRKQALRSHEAGETKKPKRIRCNNTERASRFWYISLKTLHDEDVKLSS